MPYATDRDRDPHQLELERVIEPAPPLNLFATSGYQPGVFNLRWEDPSTLSLNSVFKVVGVNLYRSFDSEWGPFDRLNDAPIGTTFWRDQTDNCLVWNEKVEADQWILRGVETAEVRGRRYVLRTQRFPIVKEGSQAVPANSTRDVQVFVDGVEAVVLAVNGTTGEIELDVVGYHDVVTQQRVAPVVPGPNSTVTVTYRYNRTVIRTDLAQRLFYRVTTVGYPARLGQCCADDLLETPLARAAATSNAEIEKLDWIWREAVRRNHWILDQGGERVKVFLQKQNGQVCPCTFQTNSGQPINDCRLCYGTGFLGGFEGPFDIVIAPDDGPRSISQRDTGRIVEHAYDVWAGPAPLLSQRDFIVKIDGSRYSIGPVHRPSNRGMILQQHFTIGYFSQLDIRYSVPVDNPNRRTRDRILPPIPPNNAAAGVTSKPNIPDERELRGRTIAWENITY